MKKLKDQVAAAIKLQGSVNDQLSSVEIQMANKNLGRDVSAYNALVNRQNQLVVKYRTAQKQAKGAQKQLESFQVDVSTYMLELPRYETRFEKHRDADKGTEEKRRVFYEEVARNLVDFQKDYEDFVMPHEQMGGHKILIAELNFR
jgi:hypothetical protein